MFNTGSVFFGNADVKDPAANVNAVIFQNGLSADTGSTATNPIGALGDLGTGLAKFLNARFINTQGFALNFTNIGKVGGGGGASNAIIFKEDVTRVISNPILLFEDSTSTETGRINFDNLMNLAIGYQAGAAFGAGSQNNVAIGNQALNANISAGNNVAIGRHALFSHTTNNRNVAIGGFALEFDVSGQQNVAVGVEALGNNISGQDNMGIGYNSLFNLTTGNQNTSFGSGSGEGSYGASSDNVYVGYQSGLAAGAGAFVSNFNCFVGTNANCFCAWGNNNTIVGNENNGIASGVVLPMGANNKIFGYNNILIQTNNLSIFGSNYYTSLSNVALFGQPDQNAIIGAPLAGATDAGFKLQVNGNFATVNPISGLIDTAWQFGGVTVAAVALDATRYINVKVGATTYKLLVGA